MLHTTDGRPTAEGMWSVQDVYTILSPPNRHRRHHSLSLPQPQPVFSSLFLPIRALDGSAPRKATPIQCVSTVLTGQSADSRLETPRFPQQQHILQLSSPSRLVRTWIELTTMASSWIPIHDTRSSQEKDPKTDAIVRRYHKSSLTNPVLHEILKNPEESSLLLDAVRRQVSLIKCRSQDFEDGQVTIYDRALLILTNNGENMTDLGARELYLTEFLGIVPIGPVAPSKDIVARHVALQSKLTKGMMLGAYIPSLDWALETLMVGASF